MTHDTAKDLYFAVGKHGSPDADADFKAIAEATRARLKALSAALYPCYEAARAAGDDDRADALDNAISRIDILWISVGQALVRFLDQSADVAAARTSIEAINCKLEDAHDQSEKMAADLGKVTKVLGDLTKLIGWVEKA